MKTLPKKPSALLKIALIDLELIQKDHRYKIEMDTWHERVNPTTCMVCVAGAVMAKTLKASILKDLVPSEFEPEEAKLLAIDEFRTGAIDNALGLLGLKSETLPDYYSNSWEGDVYLGSLSHHDFAQWLLHMQTIIGILEAEGL